MTVWAVHPIKFDISAAERFGAIRYINRRYIYSDELEPSNDDWIKRDPDKDPIMIWTPPSEVTGNLIAASNEFSPGHDFLAIVGDHLQLMQFTAILLARLSYIDVLRYDRKIMDYVPIRIYSILDFGHISVLASSSHIGDATNGKDCQQGQIPRQPADDWVGGLDAARERRGLVPGISARQKVKREE